MALTRVLQPHGRSRRSRLACAIAETARVVAADGVKDFVPVSRPQRIQVQAAAGIPWVTRAPFWDPFGDRGAIVGPPRVTETGVSQHSGLY